MMLGKKVELYSNLIKMNSLDLMIMIQLVLQIEVISITQIIVFHHLLNANLSYSFVEEVKIKQIVCHKCSILLLPMILSFSSLNNLSQLKTLHVSTLKDGVETITILKVVINHQRSSR